MRPATPVRIALAALLVVSAGGFALAAREERSREAASAKAFGLPEGSPAREATERGVSTTISTTIAAPTATAPNPLTAPEGSPEREAAERSQHGPPTSLSPTTMASPTSTPANVHPTATTIASAPPMVGETLFGVRTESSAATALVVAVLLVGAISAVVARRRRTLLGIAAVVGALALLDAREALHQHDEGRVTLLVAAVGLAAVHLMASGLGLLAYRQTPPDAERADRKVERRR